MLILAINAPPPRAVKTYRSPGLILARKSPKLIVIPLSGAITNDNRLAPPVTVVPAPDHSMTETPVCISVRAVAPTIAVGSFTKSTVRSFVPLSLAIVNKSG